jgi:hypothetical protein
LPVDSRTTSRGNSIRDGVRARPPIDQPGTAAPHRLGQHVGRVRSSAAAASTFLRVASTTWTWPRMARDAVIVDNPGALCHFRQRCILAHSRFRSCTSPAA